MVPGDTTGVRGWSAGMLDGAGSPAEVYARYAPVYDLLFGDWREDVDFYVRCAERLLDRGDAVVELGIGTARVGSALVERGYRVIGVDACPAMLRQAAARLGSVGAAWKLVLAEAAEMDLGERVRLIIGPFGFVGHLYTDASRLATFRAVHRHLEPDGCFIQDDAPFWLAGRPEPATVVVTPARLDPATGLLVRLTTNVVCEHRDDLCVFHDLVEWLDGERVVRREELRLPLREIGLEPDLALLREAGFRRIGLLGGFDGRPFDRLNPAGCNRLIMVCQRGEE